MFTVVICSATRLSEADFFERSALGRCLRQTYRNFPLKLEIAFDNREGLGVCYNRAISRLSGAEDEIALFVHDDLSIIDFYWLDKLKLGLSQFHLVGLAGNQRRVPKQPGWAFTGCLPNNEFLWDSNANLSGAVGHGTGFPCDLTIFGPALQRCALLDGIFLAAASRTLLEREIRFDEQFLFHFYDLDLCRTFDANGLTMGTVPLGVVHEGRNKFGTPDWWAAYAAYLRKWGA